MKLPHHLIFTNTFSTIDLIFSSSFLPPKLAWSTYSDLCNGDQVPIVITPQVLPLKHPTSLLCWLINKVNWSYFYNFTSDTSSFPNSPKPLYSTGFIHQLHYHFGRIIKPSLLRNSWAKPCLMVVQENLTRPKKHKKILPYLQIIMLLNWLHCLYKSSR